MSEFQRLWTRAADDEIPASAGGKHDAREWQERVERRNSNELAANAIAQHVIGRSLTCEELRVAAPLCHYTFGSVVGALYGWSMAGRRHNALAGTALGTGVWLAADELAMPMLGLSDPTTERPVEMHLQSLASHLVFGLVAEMTRGVMSPPDSGSDGAYRAAA